MGSNGLLGKELSRYSKKRDTFGNASSIAATAVTAAIVVVESATTNQGSKVKDKLQSKVDDVSEALANANESFQQLASDISELLATLSEEGYTKADAQAAAAEAGINSVADAQAAVEADEQAEEEPATTDEQAEETPATTDEQAEEEPATTDEQAEEAPATTDEQAEEAPATTDEQAEEAPATTDEQAEVTRKINKKVKSFLWPYM